jgi:hypothetical protein
MLSLTILGQQLNEILVLKNNWKLDIDNLEISSNPFVSSSFGLSFMSLDSRASRRRRGLSPEINPIAEIGRRNIVLSAQQSALRRTLSDSSSSSFFPSSIIHKMASSGGSGGTGSAPSSQSSSSSVIGSLYSHHIPVQSTTNPTKVIKKYGLFQFEEDATTTPWHVSSPLNLAPATHPLPKFKEHLPRFSGNNTVSTNEHLVAFSNACHNIGANDNDTCMRLFVNSLEGKVVADFFDLPPKILSTWEELIYWFRSTYGKSKSPTEKLREYNNVTYKDGETIKSFNLHFTKLYNQIPELIRPQNQAAFMHYYNAFPSPYHHRLEEKSIDNLGSTLHTCSEYEEQLERTGLPQGESVRQTDMSTLLQLVQDMNNHMIAFERKGTVSPLTPGASSSSAPPFRNPVENNFQPKAILPRSWCNFCEEHHEETTCEVKKSARDKIFGKRPEATIVVLDFAEPEDVMVINTRNKAYAPKGKFDPPRSSSSPSSSSTVATLQVPKVPESQGITPPLPSSKYNILNQLANIKADATLLDMVVIPEQQMHLKQFMEGKSFIVANLSEEVNEEDSSVNKVGVHNFRYPVKNPPFYISVKIMDKIAHCCLIDGGSGPSVMSKIIMEEIGLSCTNENARSMLSYNSLQQKP